MDVNMAHFGKKKGQLIPRLASHTVATRRISQGGSSLSVTLHNYTIIMSYGRPCTVVRSLDIYVHSNTYHLKYIPFNIIMSARTSTIRGSSKRL